jgi:hypothetical protein
MPGGPEAGHSTPDRATQERAASAGGNAAMLVVIDALGGMGAVEKNASIGQVMRHNLAAFRAELGRPLSEVEGPDFMAEIPEFLGIDAEDSTRVVPKLQTAYDLYTTAMRRGLTPKQLQEDAEETFAHLDPEDLIDAGLDTALSYYAMQWDNETPGFERIANEQGPDEV